MNDKSDEYAIRYSTVRQLMAEGWDRRNIRIEIPMSTASSGGRGDIVLLDDDYTACIELKSGRDKLESELLKAQMEQYHRAFDRCAVIADDSLYYRIERSTARSKSFNHNFKHVDLSYEYDWLTGGGKFRRDPRTYENGDSPCVGEIMPIIFPPWRSVRSRYTSVIDMAQILWADELREIFGGKGTKSGLELKAKEEMSVSQFRPLLIKALRARPLNEWEIKFWKAFDGVEEKSTLAREADFLRLQS